MVGSIVAVAVLAALVWFVPGAQAKETDSAVRSALAIRRALELWREDNPSACPSVSQLVHEGYLDKDAEQSDPWGGRFRILCDDASAEERPRSRTGHTADVVSAGPDEQMGTSDDVVLRVDN